MKKVNEELIKLIKESIKEVFTESSYTIEIKKLLSENGFSFNDIYDVENVSGLISSFKLNCVLPKYLYEGIDFELDNPGGIIIFSTDLNSTLSNAETIVDKVKFFFDSKWKTILNRLNVSDRLRKIYGKFIKNNDNLTQSKTLAQLL